MKKTILIAAILMCCTNALAINIIYVRPPVQESSPVYTFRYNTDNPSGTDYAYTNSGSGSMQAVYMSASAETAQKYDGVYSALANANGDHIRWDTFSESYIDWLGGSIEMWIYVDAESLTGKNPLFETYKWNTPTYNIIWAEILADGTVFFKHMGNSIAVTMTTTATISTQTWQRIRFRWSVSEDKIGVQVGTNGWEDDSDGDSVTDATDSVDLFRIGDGAQGAYVLSDDVYYDHVEIMNSYNTFND